MTHDDALDLSAIAIDFTLSPAERASLDRHLATCSSCRAEAAALRATAVRLSNLRPIEPPEWVWEKVMRPRRRPLALSLVAATLLLAALVGAAIVVGALLQDRAIVIGPTSPPGPVPSATQELQASPTPVTAVLRERTSDIAGEPSIFEVIATPDGFLAHGWFDGPAQALMLRGGPDGASWQALDAQAAFGSPLESLAAGPNGYLAVRGIGGPSEDGGTEAWLSSDGRTWERVDQPAWASFEVSAPVVGGPWGYAVEGLLRRAGDSVPAVWASRDGRSWSQMPLAEGNGYLVVHDAGAVHVEHDTGRVRETRDGRSWTERTSLPIAGAVRLIALAGRLVAVAPAQGIFVGDVSAGAGDLQWQLVHDLRGTSDSLTFAAVASRTNQALILAYDLGLKLPVAMTSSEGLVWAESTLGSSAFGGGVPDRVVGSANTFLALGWDTNEIGETRDRAWVSADGISWARAGAGPLLPMPPATTPSCPTDPSLEDLVSPTFPASASPVCFGDRPITLRGFAHGCGGCGGVTGMTGTPAWLADPLGYFDFWIGPTADPESLRLGVEIDPASGLETPAPGAFLEVTGHFSDPASADCRWEPFAGEFAYVPPVPAVQAGCRQRFVASSIRVITAAPPAT